MEWLTYLICKDPTITKFQAEDKEERKNISQVWKELTFGLETISIENVFKIIFKDKGTTDALIQDENVCKWIKNNLIKTHPMSDTLLKDIFLILEKLGRRGYIPNTAAFQIYQKIEHKFQNKWIETVKILIEQFQNDDIYISSEKKKKIGQKISCLIYNLRNIFDVTIEKPENLLANEKIWYKPGYLRVEIQK